MTDGSRATEEEGKPATALLLCWWEALCLPPTPPHPRPAERPPGWRPIFTTPSVAGGPLCGGGKMKRLRGPCLLEKDTGPLPGIPAKAVCPERCPWACNSTSGLQVVLCRED